MLQAFSENLDVELDELMENLNDVLSNFRDYSRVYAAPSVNFKFPNDLIGSVDTVDILQAVGDTIPSPIEAVFKKALQAVTFAPLLPIMEKVKSSDLEGALSDVMTSTAVLNLLSKFDEEMPRSLLRQIFANDVVQREIEHTIKSSDKLRPPLIQLQNLIKNSDQISVQILLENFEAVLASFKSLEDKALVVSGGRFGHQPQSKASKFNFPLIFISKSKPADILGMISDKIPAPFGR